MRLSFLLEIYVFVDCLLHVRRKRDSPSDGSAYSDSVDDWPTCVDQVGPVEDPDVEEIPRPTSTVMPSALVSRENHKDEK